VCANEQRAGDTSAGQPAKPAELAGVDDKYCGAVAVRTKGRCCGVTTSDRLEQYSLSTIIPLNIDNAGEELTV
jgi:hypothetical protein